MSGNYELWIKCLMNWAKRRKICWGDIYKLEFGLRLRTESWEGHWNVAKVYLKSQVKFIYFVYILTKSAGRCSRYAFLFGEKTKGKMGKNGRSGRQGEGQASNMSRRAEIGFLAQMSKILLLLGLVNPFYWFVSAIVLEWRVQNSLSKNKRKGWRRKDNSDYMILLPFKKIYY